MYVYIYICYIYICIHIHKLYIHLVHWNCTSIGNSQRSDAPTAKPPPECSKQKPTPGTGHFAGQESTKNRGHDMWGSNWSLSILHITTHVHYVGISLVAKNIKDFVEFLSKLWNS